MTDEQYAELLRKIEALEEDKVREAKELADRQKRSAERYAEDQERQQQQQAELEAVKASPPQPVYDRSKFEQVRNRKEWLEVKRDG